MAFHDDDPNPYEFTWFFVIPEAIAPLLTLNSDPELILVFAGLAPQLCHALLVALDLSLIILPQQSGFDL